MTRLASTLLPIKIYIGHLLQRASPDVLFILTDGNPEFPFGTEPKEVNPEDLNPEMVCNYYSNINIKSFNSNTVI